MAESRRTRWTSRALPVLAMVVTAACAPPTAHRDRSVPTGRHGERARALALYPGVTATIVAPAGYDSRRPVELILYALPNGNTTAETIGRAIADVVGWRHDIQHIGAQTRALRARGLRQAVVAYLEADTRSWPEWRRRLGYERANTRIVGIVDQIRMQIGDPEQLSVTLTGHSGGGSFTWGFLDGQEELPAWLTRIAFLDSNYSFEARHGTRIVEWLSRGERNTLVVMAYDDREVTVDGRKVVSDSGGTWRASERMISELGRGMTFTTDTLGEFIRHRAPQVEVLMHLNPANRILHTELIGEMNGYMHAVLAGRAGYDASTVLRPGRVYSTWVDTAADLPPASPPGIPARRRDAPTGSTFIAAIEGLAREDRERAILGELLAGNVPLFLRTLRTVTVRGQGTDGSEHSLSYDVMPDYLAIGSDDDFVRMPMSPHTAQAFADAFGFVLPTKKMVGDIHAAAGATVDPRPLTDERESPRAFLVHHRIIEAQLTGRSRGLLVSGIKKDLVVTNRLQERPARVAIFGWHRTDGTPIQPLYVGHVDWYVDYSHGVRPVRRAMRLDGRPVAFEFIIGDSVLAGLLSDEGVVGVARYER